MKLWVLGSGSSGNAVLVESGDSRVLVDAGFGTRTLATRLRTIGIAPGSIEACIVTHEHTDHVKGAAAGARRWGWTLYASEGTVDAWPELQQVLPELQGEDLLRGLISFARACHWTEHTNELIATAQQLLEVAPGLGAEDYVAPALGRLSQGYAMRGGEGDLAEAVETGERALLEWVPDTHGGERAEHEHLLADQYIWLGDYRRAYELAMTAQDHAVGRRARSRGSGAVAWARWSGRTPSSR